MKVTSVFATVTFKLILEFNNSEYRLLDIKQFLQNDDLGKLAEIRENIDVFRKVKVDKKARTVCWENGIVVDFDPEILYNSSLNIDHILGNEGEMKHEKF